MLAFIVRSHGVFAPLFCAFVEVFGVFEEVLETFFPMETGDRRVSPSSSLLSLSLSAPAYRQPFRLNANPREARGSTSLHRPYAFQYHVLDTQALMMQPCT